METRSLEELLRQAAPALAGITLHKCQDGNWQAATTRDKLGWQVTVDTDQIVAMRKALNAFMPSVLPTDNTDAEDIFS